MHEKNSSITYSKILPYNLWLQILVANLPQGVLLVDAERKITICNKQLCHLFKVPHEPEQLIGKHPSEFLNQHLFIEDISIIADRIHHLVENKVPVYEDELKLSDGRILLRDYIPVWIDAQFEGHMWIFYDETENFKAARSIEIQKKFYENILNSIPTDIAVFSPSQQYLFLNPQAVKDDCLRNWLIGKTDFDYCALREKDISIAQKRRDIFLNAIENKKEVEWEEVLDTSHGNKSYLRKMSPVYDEEGKLEIVIGYGLNITERKKIEAQIQLSEKRYRDLFNYSLALICTHDVEGTLLKVNPALHNALEYSETEMLGKKIYDFLLEKDKPNFENFYLKSLLLNKKVEGVFKVICKSGKKAYLFYQNYLVEDPGNSPYVVSFSQDVTDRIITEKQLIETKKKTEETIRAKEKFLANMSHEIRTPMNGILGITSLLEKTQLNEKQKHYVTVINESADNLLNIINDIIDLEKIGAGKIQLEKIPFNISGKIQSVINLFEFAADNKKLELVFQNHFNQDICVIGDPTRLTQILNNLISNAIKFTHKGCVTVHARIEEETGENFKIRITVTDSGIGIDEEKLQNIFHPFTQAYAETTRLYGGSGLGLAIVKDLVELQDGSIYVESKLNAGTSFHVILPYNKTQGINHANTPAAMNTEQFKTLKVLVAEDNEVNLLLTCRILEFWGVETKIANNGVQVLQQLNDNNFDLILMDIQMPEKNGIETTKEIRALKDHNKRNLPIIALTANAMKGEELKYLSAGMDGYLTKPFKEKELYNSMLNIFKNHKPEINNAENNLYDFTFLKNMESTDEEFISSLKQIFIKNIPPTAKQMIKACEQQHWSSVSQLAHKLKSSIDTLNIKTLKAPIRHIEQCAKHGKALDTLQAEAIKINDTILLAVKQMQQEK